MKKFKTLIEQTSEDERFPEKMRRTVQARNPKEALTRIMVSALGIFIPQINYDGASDKYDKAYFSMSYDGAAFIAEVQDTK